MSGAQRGQSSAPQEIITDSAGLARLCERLAAAGQFAFDTEFVGEDSYEPQICLVQIATDEFTALVDPLSGLSIDPIWKLLADPRLRVLVHAGSEDLTHCYRQSGEPPANVIDLQIGAGLLGWGYPISLSRLVMLTTGAKLHKSQTLTDWRRRPLAPEQIVYAREDVQYLPAAYAQMTELLCQRGREPWLVEECAAMCDVGNFAAKSVKKLRRLRGAASLSPAELLIVDALLGAREQIARRLNRPARVVLRDHLLVEIARRGWHEPARLRTLRGMNLSNADLRTLALAVEAAKKTTPGPPAAAAEEEHLTPEEEVVVMLITALLRDIAHRSGLSYSLLATRQDIGQAARYFQAGEDGRPRPTLLSGWRGEAVGALLTRVFAGQARIRIGRKANRLHLDVED